MKKIILLVFAAYAFTSCTDYIKVNDDQSNNATNSDLIPPVMFAGSVNTYINLQNVNMADFGNRGAYVWSLNTGFTSTEPLYSYQFTSNDYSVLFNNTFLAADNFQNILDRERKFPQYSYHYAASRIFKVMCMDYVTALYGDVPYTEAFDLEKFAFPKYEDDKKIIPKLFLELDAARALLLTPATNVESFGSEDIVFQGDLAKWEELLNTVELRLLMRLSKTTDANLIALRTQRFSRLPQSFISYDVKVNPGYNGSTFGQRCPISRVWGLNEARNAWSSSNRAMAAGDFAAKLVNGQLNTPTLVSTGLVDPRRSRLFNVIGTTVNGAVQGVFPTVEVSRFASFYHGRSSFVSTPDADNNAETRDCFLMLNAESQFLQAEAYQRGYMVGSAQAAFENGIKASFDFYSTGWGSLFGAIAPVSPAATYITQINSRIGLGWGASTDKISCIITQKYLALSNWHGIELYLDHLRTGYPVLPLPVGALKPNRPLRLIYPNSEYTSNSANVPNVTNNDIYTVNSFTPYYLQ
jgi:Starch-binding associating with outer membrane